MRFSGDITNNGFINAMQLIFLMQLCLMQMEYRTSYSKLNHIYHE